MVAHRLVADLRAAEPGGASARPSPSGSRPGAARRRSRTAGPRRRGPRTPSGQGARATSRLSASSTAPARRRRARTAVERRARSPGASGVVTGSADRAGRADLPERAPAAREVVRLRGRSPGPGSRPRRSGWTPAPCRSACASTGAVPDEARLQEVQRDGVRQPAGHRLVAHRVDRQLERLLRALARLRRVPHVRRLVVRDRRRAPGTRTASAPRRPRRRASRTPARHLGRRAVARDDVHAVVPAADPVPVEQEAELALHVGRDRSRPGASCSSRNRRSDARPASSRASSCSRDRNPSDRQAAVNDAHQVVLAHHVAAGVALVELRDGRVERGAVDDRVVGRERDPQHVRELVLERAGQVVVDGVEARASAARPSATAGPPATPPGARGRDPLQRRGRLRPGPGSPRRPRAGPAPRARTATRAAPAGRRSPPRG